MRPFSSTVFHREKEAIDHRFGCSLDRTTYTRSIENGRWRGAAQAKNHKGCSSSESKPPLKAAPDAVSGCMPDADMHSVGSFKSLAGQGFSDNDAVNVVPIYF